MNSNDRSDANYEEGSQRDDGSIRPNDEPREKAAEVERDIERTRQRMTGNIDTLGQRLSPQHLKEQAQEAISEKAQQVVAEIGDQARKTGDRIVEFVAGNPLPVAAATLGALWLFTKRSRSDVSGDRMARFAYTGPDRRLGGGMLDRMSAGAEDARKAVTSAAADAAERVEGAVRQTRERAGDLVAGAKEGLKDVGGRVGEQAQQARGGISRLLEEDPLIIMAGAAVLGVALGSLLPGTRREDQLMGRTRDAVVDRAETVVRQVKATAIDAGHQVADAVQDQIVEKGPEVKGALQDAADQIGKKVSESASRVMDESKRAASS